MYDISKSDTFTLLEYNIYYIKKINLYGSIPNKSGSVYEEIKYYYNIRVLPFIREQKLKNLLNEKKNNN